MVVVDLAAFFGNQGVAFRGIQIRFDYFRNAAERVRPRRSSLVSRAPWWHPQGESPPRLDGVARST